MKKIFIVIIISIPAGLWITSSSSCNKGCPDRLFYRIPYEVYPMRDTFAVGDTLWVELNFSKDMTDEIGNIKNSFPNFDFQINAGCERIDIDPPLAHTLDFLSIHTLIGSDSSANLPVSGVSYYRLVPVYSLENYTFKCFFIVKEKGLFSFGLGSTASTEENPLQFNGVCDNIPIQFGSHLANDSENNYHILQWATNPAYHRIDAQRFRDYGGYCFVVR